MFALHFSFAEQNLWVLHFMYALENNNMRTPCSIFNLLTCFAASLCSPLLSAPSLSGPSSPS